MQRMRRDATEVYLKGLLSYCENRLEHSVFSVNLLILYYRCQIRDTISYLFLWQTVAILVTLSFKSIRIKARLIVLVLKLTLQHEQIAGSWELT